MDIFVASIQQLSSTGGFPQLNEHLKQNWDNLLNCARDGEIHQVVGDVLDPSTASLGLLYVLCAKGTVLQETEVSTFFDKTKLFLLNCDATQIKLNKKLFVELCRKFTECACLYGLCKSGLVPLQVAAIKLLDGVENKTPSPIDVDFLQLCLLSGCYPQGASHIDKLSPILSVDPENTQITALDMLRLWYQSGMIRIGLKQFDKALQCFISCISMPAKSLSAVAVEAYKKCILVSLIVNGEMPALPPFTASVVSRVLKGNKDVYQSMGDLYLKDDVKGLQALITAESGSLNSDKNLGLAKQVVEVLMRTRVFRLSRCYKTLSLEDMTAKTELSDIQQTEKILLDLIGRGELNASIDQQASLVYFGEENETCEASAAEVNQGIQNIVDLSKRVRELDVMFAKHPKFIKSGNRGQTFEDDESFLDDMEQALEKSARSR